MIKTYSRLSPEDIPSNYASSRFHGKEVEPIAGYIAKYEIS